MVYGVLFSRVMSGVIAASNIVTYARHKNSPRLHVQGQWSSLIKYSDLGPLGSAVFAETLSCSGLFAIMRFIASNWLSGVEL